MDCKPRGPFPAYPHAEVALIIVEAGNLLGEEVGYVSRDEGIVPVLAAIHEDPFFLRMCVQVDKKEAVLPLWNFSFGIVDLWTAELTLAMPDAIEIITGKTTSVWAIDDPIGVQHGNNLEDEAFS